MTLDQFVCHVRGYFVNSLANSYIWTRTFSAPSSMYEFDLCVCIINFMKHFTDFMLLPSSYMCQSHDTWHMLTNGRDKNRSVPPSVYGFDIQSTLVISTSVISNNRLSQRENLIPG